MSRGEPRSVSNTVVICCGVGEGREGGGMSRRSCISIRKVLKKVKEDTLKWRKWCLHQIHLNLVFLLMAAWSIKRPPLMSSSLNHGVWSMKGSCKQLGLYNVLNTKPEGLLKNNLFSVIILHCTDSVCPACFHDLTLRLYSCDLNCFYAKLRF